MDSDFGEIGLPLTCMRRRRIDLRLVIAAVLAVGLLVSVLAIAEYRHHRRIVRWHELGMALANRTNGRDWLPGSTADHGTVIVRPLLPSILVQRLPREWRLTWFVRPESLFVSAPAPLDEILEVAGGSQLTRLHIAHRYDSTARIDLGRIAQLRTLDWLSIHTQEIDGGHLSGVKDLPNLKLVRLECQTLTPRAIEELSDLPPQVRLILAPYSPPKTMVAQVKDLQTIRNVEVDGTWSVWFKETRP
jgi:hypothetical protein